MTRPGPLPVAATAVAGFLGVLTFLGVQLRDGRDPALGAVNAPAPAPKQVLVKRVIKRKVVVTVKPAAGEANDAPAVSTSAPTQSSAPAPAAPAPAPAPVSTGSS